MNGIKFCDRARFPEKVLVIGAGLAGSDCSFFLAQAGVQVVLVESKGLIPTPAQKLKTAAELVCTNSLKSLNPGSSHGLLKREMKELGSLVLQVGEKHSVPAGDALAVDREKFSQTIHDILATHPLIDLQSEEISNPLEAAKKYGCEKIVVATGPLTLPGLEKWIQGEVSEEDFYFYDAIAPVVDADSLDLSKMYYKDRHKEPNADADYLNAPLNKEEYELFVEALVEGEKVPPQNFERLKFFESCLPIDTMAERGKDTPRFSCMKPIGLETPDGKRPYAVVQLRKENLLGSAYNMVGFQTRLKYPEQLRIFRMIPGFEKASFNHLGSVHRNSFLNSRKLLNSDLSWRKHSQVYFAGQITGVEGYTESASMGLYVGFQILRKLQGKEFLSFPVETGLGALVNYIMTAERPAPSNINFGLFPEIEVPKKKMPRQERKKLKKQLLADRAKKTWDDFFQQIE